MENKKDKTKIYCFIDGIMRMGCVVVAVGADGEKLCSHLSSNKGWAKIDIGIESERKHDIYDKEYPDGWEIEWVDDPINHKGIKLAYERNKKKYNNGGNK